MRARLLLVVSLVGAATSCMHVARVFLDIPEDSGSPRSGSAVPADFVAGSAPAQAVPAEIESLDDDEAMLDLLPELSSGEVDWVAAWRTDVIRPRGRDGPELPDSTADFSYDLYLSTGEGPEAYFPHSTHRDWMTCESCHPRVYRNGGDSYSRSNAHEQDSCGKCHGPVAFQIQSCEECHDRADDLPPGRQEKSLGEAIQLERVEGQGIGQDFDLVDAYPPASFAHGPHRLRYQCRACHENPFPMTSGATVLERDDAHSAQGCGSCHDGVIAFGADLDTCNQCHIPTGG